MALGQEDSLRSVNQLALGKDLFTECLFWALGKVYFYFLNFGNQTFCGMFLYYVDLHVPFWDNYNNVIGGDSNDQDKEDDDGPRPPHPRVHQAIQRDHPVNTILGDIHKG